MRRWPGSASAAPLRGEELREDAGRLCEDLGDLAIAEPVGQGVPFTSISIRFSTGAISRGAERRSGFHDLQPGLGKRLAQDGEIALGPVRVE